MAAPLSASISPGTQALSSQYNYLRDDAIGTVALTNASGGAITRGQLCMPGPTANTFVLATANYTGPVMIAIDASIANGATGLLTIGSHYVTSVVSTGTIAVGDYLTSHGTGGAVESVGATYINNLGIMGMALSADSGGYVDVLVFGTGLNGGANGVGSVSTPGVFFAAATNYGLFQGTNYIGVSIAGTEVARFTNTGLSLSAANFSGSTSGTATLQATAVAGTPTLSLPTTTGTLVGTGDTGTVTNTMLAGSIANNKLANSTISGISLGSSLNTVTFNNGGAGDASGTTYDGSTARTISYNSVGASPLAGSSSITTVGTITSGTWNGSTITAGYGGTGLATYTAGDLLYATAATTISKLGIGAANTVLTSTGSAPAWSSTLTSVTLSNSTLSGTVSGTPTWSSTQAVSISGSAPAGSLTGTTLASGVTASSLTSVGTLTSLTMGGTLTVGANTLALASATVSGSPTWSANQAITLSTASQPNVTSLGTLTSLTISGNLTLSAASPSISGSSASSTITIASQRTAANTGIGLKFNTYGATNVATTRFQLTSGVDIATATWSNVYHVMGLQTVTIGNTSANTNYDFYVDTLGLNGGASGFGGALYALSGLDLNNQSITSVGSIFTTNVIGPSTTGVLTVAAINSTGGGARALLYGWNATGNTGNFVLSTPNATHNADVTRLTLTGVTTTAVATWLQVTHTGFVTTASTTSTPSLRITSGTAPSSPTDGDMWYDGTNLKFRFGSTTSTFAFGTTVASAATTSDVTYNNTSTVSNVTGLSFSVDASSVYYVEFTLYVNQANASASGFYLALTMPTGSTFTGTTNYFVGSVAPNLSYGSAVASGATIQAYQPSYTGNQMIKFCATVTVSTTAGTVQLQAAQRIAHASDSKILAKSSLIAAKTS